MSTGGMCKWAKKSDAKTILVGTELGICHRLRKENPDKEFIPVAEHLICPNMKKTTLLKLRDCLRDMTPQVKGAEEIAEPARRAIARMLAI